MLCTKLKRSIVSESTNDQILSHVVIRCSNVGETVVIECGSDHFHLITFHAKVNGRVTPVALAVFPGCATVGGGGGGLCVATPWNTAAL